MGSTYSVKKLNPNHSAHIAPLGFRLAAFLVFEYPQFRRPVHKR